MYIYIYVYTLFAYIFNSSSRKHHNFQVTVPDSITSWMVEGFSLSKKYGLALADPVSVRTFKKFFLDFNLPYSVIRGEQVRIPITVYNYYDTCVAVSIAFYYLFCCNP